LALPLGELSPQVTEGLAAFFDALSVLAVLGHLSQRERQGMLARYTGRCPVLLSYAVFSNWLLYSSA